MDAITSKWDQIYSKSDLAFSTAIEVLSENNFLLPKTGLALDLACGLGANAIFLAEHGLAVTAWDTSAVAINKLTAYAALKDLNISACQEKIIPNSLPESLYDVIVVSRFLDRSLSDAIIEGLKPDGLLFYQTFIKEKTSPKPPNNPDYLLRCGEMLEMFSPLKLIFYRENALIGNQLLGLRNEAQFVGQKRNLLVTL
jgi:SAM-dependent methyltransferase